MRAARVLFAPFAALSFIVACRLAPAENHLDPSRDIAQPRPESPIHQPLPEQYIWKRHDAAALWADHGRYFLAGSKVKANPHYFRDAFTLVAVSLEATPYVVGQRSARIYQNGPKGA